jgi:hypothetical protein
VAQLEEQLLTAVAPPCIQVCKKSIDRKEKGLHCSNGGHRICWGCMVDNIKWEVVVEKEPGKLGGDVCLPVDK